MLRFAAGLVAAGALGLASMSVVPSALATGATCDGLAATIVSDTPGAEVEGTQGDDVIVAHGAGRVDAHGGDDHVCVDGNPDRVGDPDEGDGGVYVDAGLGDDVVDTSQEPTGSVEEVDLGPGSDTLVGGPGSERVYDGDRHNGPSTPTGHDTISTGAGRDRVDVGRPGGVSTDVVDTGPDDDFLSVYGLPHGSYDGGTAGPPEDGSSSPSYLDEVWFRDPPAGSWAVDLTGSSHAGAASFTVRRFTLVVLRALRAPSVSVVGDREGERFDVGEQRGHAGRVLARLEGGDDDLSIHDVTGGHVAGGGGDDTLELTGLTHVRNDAAVLEQDATLSVPRHRLTLTHARPVRVTGFEGYGLSFVAHATFVGGSASQTVTTQACAALAHLGAGDDSAVAYRSPDWDCAGERHSARFFGGPGDDVLTGSTGRDELYGGPGRDVADGEAGRDTCVAEVERSC